MTRAIKFRFFSTNPKHSEHGKMTYPESYSSNDLIAEDNWSVMQSIGLFDKNGKEIFEGDILRYERKGLRQNTYRIAYVQYDDKATRFNCYRVDGQGKNVYKGIQSLKEPEIIGNIYENPELIKKP